MGGFFRVPGSSAQLRSLWFFFPVSCGLCFGESVGEVCSRAMVRDGWLSADEEWPAMVSEGPLSPDWVERPATPRDPVWLSVLAWVSESPESLIRSC